MTALARAWRALSSDDAQRGASARSHRRSRNGHPYPLRTCHFCNNESLILPAHPEEGQDGRHAPHHDTLVGPSSQRISTGTPDRWYCASCTCWNTCDVHDIGGIASWDPAMADQRLNKHRLASSASLVNGNAVGVTSMLAAPSPFCHTCQTNQTLLLSMAANYEAVQENRDLEHTENEIAGVEEFDAWYTQLEARYPPLCATCQDRAEERIREADSRARRLIWSGWLRRQRGQQPNRVFSSPRHSETIKIDDHEAAQRMVSQRRYLYWWHLQGLCFWAAWLGPLVPSVACWMRPSLSPTPTAIFGAMATTALYWTSRTWDPTLPRQAAMLSRRAPETPVRVKGLERWKTLHRDLFILRLFALCLSCCLSGMTWKQSVALVVVVLSPQVVLAWSAYSGIAVHEPPAVSLKSRANGSVHSHDPKKQLRVCTQGSFRQALDDLSLQQYAARPGLEHESDNGKDDEGNETMIIHDVDQDGPDDSMDWSPTPALPGTASRDGSARKSWNFGPQRVFGNNKDTGLEELVSTRLAVTDKIEGDAPLLEDVQMRFIDQKLEQGTRGIWTRIIFTSAIIAIFALCLHAILHDWMQVVIVQTRSRFRDYLSYLKASFLHAKGPEETLDRTMWHQAVY